MEKLIILPETKIKELFNNELDKVLCARIPEIIRQANRKTYMTTAEVEELIGLSSRAQKYHRDSGNLQYAQDGRKIIYRTVDVEQFIEQRKVAVKK